MLTRRTLVLATVALGMTALRFGPARAQSAAPASLSAAEATDFIRKTGAELVAVVNGPGTIAERQAKLAPMIDSAVDVDGVGLFCLGRFARSATPQQKQDYLRLFHTVLLRSVTGKLGDYAGVTLTVGRAEVRDDGVHVDSVVVRPNSQPANVQFVVQEIDNRPRIVDVIAEGTSLRLTQRTDYASYLSHNNDSLQALIDAMRRQINAGG
jgi:phospholipid transport system substrate-binding protein